MIALVAIAIASVATALVVLVSRRVGWAAAGPLVILAMTPLVPRVPVLLGFSLDDVLPLVGLAGLLVAGRGASWRVACGWPRLLLAAAVAGVVLAMFAGVISSVLVGTSAADALRLLLRGSGRLLLLSAVAVAAAATVSRQEGARRLVAQAIALMGTFEGAFGIFAFLVPLPDRIGLGGRKGPGSVLVETIPGRITGTLGIEANFLAAILLVSSIVTVGLATQSRARRERLLLTGAAVVQVAALVLTFSRAPLALALLGIVAVVLMSKRPILALPIVAVVAILVPVTPILGRFLSDGTNRLALWYSGWLVMLDHPISGVGAGRMIEVIRAQPERYMQTPLGKAIANAHNSILLAGAELGVLAAVGVLLLIVSLVAMSLITAYRGWRGPDDDALALAGGVGVLAFLAQSMVNNLFTVGVTSVIGALLVGVFVLPGTATPAAVASRPAEPIADGSA